jgi:hypothetical protein
MYSGTGWMVMTSLISLLVSTAPALADTPPPGGAGTMPKSEFTNVIQEALRHAREAEAAGAKGDGPALKKHAEQAIEKAKEGQRAGHNEKLNDGVYALGDAIEHAGPHPVDATEHVKRAIMKLSQSASLRQPEAVTGGEPSRTAASGSIAFSGGYLDDGFFEDDWFYDYYEARPESGSGQAPAFRKDYRAEQLYEEVRTSGLFDF